MKLTRKAFMEKGAEVSAKRAADFNKLATEKGGSASTRLFPALMVMMNALTLNKLADNLGLTEEENEVDVTEDVFNNAVCTVTSEVAESEHSSLITMLETTTFCFTMSDALFGKGKDNETEKADS